MKKIYLTLLSCFITIVSMAQTPGFSYQAVILNPDVQSLPGNDVEQGLLSESDISIRFTIENELGTEYQETHTAKTDAYGMVSLMVGQGMATIGNFTEVAWVGAEKYLKVEIDFTASGASYESLDRQALTYLPQPLSLESNNRINDLELAINAVAADLTTIELTPGPQGNDGADGAQGPIGLTGADGTNGTNGIDGIDGVQGPIGLTGAAGTDGADGTNGTNGIDGIDGVQGPIGPSGGAQGPAGLDGNSSLWQTNNQTDFIASIMTVGGGSGRFHLDYDLINWGSAGQSTHRLIIHKMTNQPTTNDYSGWLTFIDPYDIITIRVQDFPERVMHFTVLPSGPNLTSPTTTGPYFGTFKSGDLFYLRLRLINSAPLSANTNPMNPPAFDINTPCYIGYVKTGLLGATGPIGLPGANGTDGVDGLPGADGTDGTNGIDGVDGVQGPIGLTGAAGTDGADGTNGTDGVDGIDGTNGTNGIDGLDGAQGPAGADGVGNAQTLTVSGDTLRISDGNYIIIPNISLINQLTLGCTDPLGVNYDPNANLDDGSCTLPMLGDYYQGGVVFYLDSNGGGLICDIQDIATAPFGCDYTSVPASNSTAFGTGAQNTFNLRYDCGLSAYCGGLSSGSLHITTAPSYNATNGECYTGATECYLSNAQGYNDWFLPSKDEFLAIDLGMVDSVALANGGTTFNTTGLGGAQFGGNYLTSSIYTLYPTSYYYKIIISNLVTINSISSYYMQASNGSLGEASYVRAIRAF